ncbi:MAG: HDIG domain-containing protein [Bacteroidales bacterium]|nr:HDIG domain-containing protein [Bacteroidales bacterium]
MDKVRFPSSPRVYLPLAVLFVLLVLILPKSQKLSYEYKKGSPWMYESLVADFDFPIIKTENELLSDREAAMEEFVPYFKYKANVYDEVKQAFGELDLGNYERLRPTLSRGLLTLYEAGVASNSDLKTNASVLYIQKGKRAGRYAVSSVYSISDAKAYLAHSIAGECPRRMSPDSLLLENGVSNLILPNLVYDDKTTKQVHMSTVADVSTTSGFVSSGTLIVSKGDIVTAEIQQVLDSYKAEYEATYGYNGNMLFLWLGNALLALVFVALVFFVINYTNEQLFEDFNKYLYLLLVVFLSAAAALLVNLFNPNLLYMVPFTITALFLVAFFKKKVVMPIYIISLLPLLVFAHNGVQLFLMNLFAGIVSIFTFGYFNKGWKQFVNALCVFASMLLIYFTYGLVYGIEGYISLRIIIFILVGSLFLVALYPFVFLFEKAFDLVSSSRLQDLTDTSSNKLVLDLQQIAPGTFQHSLQLMNMCEAAARSLEANVALVRAGALYHDIGKMENPQCFIENQAPGCDYHKDLTPKESARDIIKHVKDGLALAEKYHLPRVVSDFITTHHGTTSAGFFYSRYLAEGGDPKDVAEFFYDGRRPETVEQTILMVCDTLEAASRTLSDHKPETIDSFVEMIFKSKMDAGQFEESPISLKEINIMKAVLKDYIQQMYHDRIAYPGKHKKINNKQSQEK